MSNKPAMPGDSTRPGSNTGPGSNTSPGTNTGLGSSTRPGSSRRTGLARRTWTLDPGQADVVLAQARNALFVMVGVLAVIWIVQIVNFTDSYRLAYSYGIVPRDVSALPHILTAPFLHFSWAHIEGNSGPLFIFGFLAAYRGLAKFTAVTVLVVLTSGFAAWFFEPSGSAGAGASGVVFGYFGYIIVRGLFDRHAIDVLIGAVMALCFAYQFSVLLPKQGIGWQAHVGGVVGGIIAGWVFRERHATKSSPAKSKAKAVSGARPASSAGTSAGAAIQPAGKSGGKGFTVDPSNPRADLYKELDDMGL